MDKTLGLIVTAMVVMATGVIVMFMSQGGLSDLDQTSENQKDNFICSYQIDAYESGTSSFEELDENCKEQASSQAELSTQERETLSSQFSSQLTS